MPKKIQRKGNRQKKKENKERMQQARQPSSSASSSNQIQHGPSKSEQVPSIPCLPVPCGYRIPKLPTAHRSDYMKTLMQNRRQNIDYKEAERDRETLIRKRKRLNEEYKHLENKRETTQRKRKREDTEYRQKEQESNTSGRKKKREETEYRQKEQESDSFRRKTKREDTEYRQKEQESNTSGRKKKREETEYRQKEQESNSSGRKKKREGTEYRQKEQESDSFRRKRKREDAEYRQKEQESNTSGRKKKREETEYRQKEQESDSFRRKRKREDTECRQKEQESNTSGRKKKREETEYRQKEQESDSFRRKRKREDTECRQKEQESNTSGRKKKREETEYRQKEQESDSFRRKRKREDTECRQKEQESNTSGRKKKREETEYRQKEQESDSFRRKRKREDTECRQRERRNENFCRKSKRENLVYKQNERNASAKYKKAKTNATIQTLIKKFHLIVKEGPVYICTSCNQLFYKHSVSLFKQDHVSDQKLQRLIPTIHSVNDHIWICGTCKSYINKNKIPPMSVMNKMCFPEQGPLSELNPLEQNLLAVRIPFMKIHEAARGRQKIIHGNMVLVPADVDNTVTQLPRLITNDSTIKATLKRRLLYKHHVYSLNVRPELVRNCAQILSKKSLFKKHIDINTDWEYESSSSSTSNNSDTSTADSPRHLDSVINQLELPITPLPSTSTVSDEVQSMREKEHAVRSCVSHESDPLQNGNNHSERSNKENSDQDEDKWSEIDEDEIKAGMSDTLLSSQDFIEANERDKVYNFAPGEGSIPVSVFLENDIEELAFPGIFCGEKRASNDERPVNVTYGEIVKSELRNSDRRAASSIENIFFKTKKIQMKILIDQSQLLLRKVKTNNQHLTVRDLRGESMQNLIHTDKAYKALANVRGSPPYFEKVSKDLFAMIRQLGPATFFVTLSAAETRWVHLLILLGKVVDKKTYTEEEVSEFSWEDKCRLIQSDPVTCARHFDFCVNKFLHNFLLTPAQPLSQIEDYFYRVEYQNRGSPHIHMVIWCKDAPTYGTNTEEEICQFIDKYITCSLPSADSPYFDTVKLQVHRHSHTCRKKGKKLCRFGFPKPIFDRTILLEPLSTPEFTADVIKTHKENWKNIYVALNELDSSEPITYQEFISKLKISEHDYIHAVRSSIKSPTVFLKRTFAETRVNNYNDSMLQAWLANTDIQYVLDVYACATYVASYLTKSQRGMSELLRKATEEANQGDSDIRQQLKTVGNKFLNAVEISAQEAVYICLQLPMKKSSRHVVFVNTSPPEERVSLLKPKCMLDTMDEDDEDIECGNLLSRYAERPKELENITLAEFASMYEVDRKTYVSRSNKFRQKTSDKLLPENNTTQNDDEDTSTSTLSDKDSSSIQVDNNLISNKTKYRRRVKGNIIRCVHFNPDIDSEKYYRELIMLYFPWRNECNLLAGCNTFYDRFQQIQKDISDCRGLYEPYAQQVDKAQEALAADPDLQDAWDEIAPGTEDQDSRDAGFQNPPNETGIEDYNIARDLGVNSSTDSDLHDFNELQDEPYRQHMRLLNPEQVAFVNDTIHLLKTSSVPFLRFLSGGAGVGKSFVIQALYQTALKYLNKHAGDNFDTKRILLLAPTGKAAYHIKGSTIHNGLKIPPNNKLDHKPLPSGQLNTLRKQIGNIKLIIIDEISMVGFRMFNCIHQRLMEVMQSSSPFGGVSVIAVGDLYQLEPVYDSFLFQQPRKGLFPLSSNLWVDFFKMYELKQIMRQAENKQFAEILNRLREGQHTSEDLEVLKSRTVTFDSTDYPYDATHLMHKNDDVNAFNAQVILRSSNKVYTINAKDRVVGSTPHNLRNKILINFRNTHAKTCQLPNVLCACVGILYDLTVNINTADGLTNGASCQIMKIDLDETETYASGTIWVKFINESTGKSLRSENVRLYKQGIDKKWTPLQPVVKEFAAGQKGQALIQRCQFPLRPAHAKSIHRSQGDTLDTAVVDLKTNRKINHIHYVAISRLKSLDGLHITNLQEDKISIDKNVQVEMKRLRENPLQITHKTLDVNTNNFKLAFLNARSLRKHMPDIKTDRNVQASSVICFCETRFDKREHYSESALSGFKQYRQDNKSAMPTAQRSPYGLAVYSKSPFIIGPNSVSKFNIEATLFEIEEQQETTFVFVYKPPRVATKMLLEFLRFIKEHHINQSKHVVVFGDFNIDWNSQSTDKCELESLMNQFNLHQVIDEPTTDYNSTLDLIFTNLKHVNMGTVEAYYTDHKLCWISWD